MDKKDIKSLAIGAFDGMHLGHQALFKKLDKNGAILVIDKNSAVITPGNYRCEYTDKPCFFYDLNDIKDLDDKGFIKKLKKDFVNLEKIVVGYDFAFGKDRKYSIKNLKEVFDGEVEVVDEVKVDGISVHSRVIKEFIKDGDIKKANRLLGHTFKIVGEVIKGAGLGKKELVPTINLKVEKFILPKDGVYATITDVNGFYEPSVTFIGHKKSVDNSFSIETHVIGKDIQKAEGEVTILFFEKIRDNKKFENLKDLKEQILKDIEIAKEIVKEHTI
ncbi:bifunctional riboflavin kinase/FAD synthetase [Nitrosophilus kaiyonis]|uniref:bifunctional riboflavin kinase/FAD synthetase n=1 Tax=Nitrosophilus kaiyonis TaxID=2930200 RepID=UPI002490C28D|nr:bifunctional riboflavin kinase/FAD synthetase [Nitrosophilus kaiyonis]